MPAGFANALVLDVGVLEERDRALGAELEEVVPEVGRTDRRDEPGAEGAVVEAHGRVHVVGDERQVVDPSPGRGGGLRCRRDVLLLTRGSSRWLQRTTADGRDSVHLSRTEGADLGVIRKAPHAHGLLQGAGPAPRAHGGDLRHARQSPRRVHRLLHSRVRDPSTSHPRWRRSRPRSRSPGTPWSSRRSSSPARGRWCSCSLSSGRGIPSIHPAEMRVFRAINLLAGLALRDPLAADAARQPRRRLRRGCARRAVEGRSRHRYRSRRSRRS